MVLLFTTFSGLCSLGFSVAWWCEGGFRSLCQHPVLLHLFHPFHIQGVRGAENSQCGAVPLLALLSVPGLISKGWGGGGGRRRRRRRMGAGVVLDASG